MQTISLINLSFMFLPILVVGYVYFKWTNNLYEIPKAVFRMILQLLLIGYVLVYLFDTKVPSLGYFIIFFMIAVSSFIALRNINTKDFNEYKKIFISIFIGGSLNLILVIFVVLEIDTYEPRYIIPLAGMIYANSMNVISLASERFEKEIQNSNYFFSRSIAFRASLIPQINTFLAVGLVSLPGMMTGQILNGADPLIATRYQIMVMSMVLGSAGISVIIYLLLKRPKIKQN
jgi:putative ABC transport system permease protein